MSGEMTHACCYVTSVSDRSQHWVIGHQDTTAVRRVPRVSPRWGWRDRLGAWAVCWGIGRMRYTVPPGLYAVGAPTSASPLLVTANYKLSFDHVRRAMVGLGAWILVLDTKGVNVWCAAGKGTFGTDELVERLAIANVSEIIAHRTLVVPQLGAPGIAAHEVRHRSGFNVIYGPVRARDLPVFLANGLRATPDMRRVTFTLAERLTLVPVELVHRFLPALALALLFAVSSGFRSGIYRLETKPALWAAVCVFAIYGVGIILTPALLPLLPGRAFAGKGLALGGCLGALFIWLAPDIWMARLALAVLCLAGCSFLGLMFTGSTPYTSASGVKAEMRWAVPLQGGLTVIGVLGWILAGVI